MPCTKLSSGKTVCYGDDATTYSQGGTIFFNHQPVHFRDGGEVDLKLNRVPKPVKDDFDMSGGFQGNLFHNVGARGELNYGPLNMSGQAMLSGYDKGWNPNVSSNLSTNVQVNPKLNVSGNLNYNYNKGEGSQFSPTIGASYQANPNLNIGGSFTPGSNSASFSIRKKFPDGGQTIKKGPGPFLVPESRPQFKSMPVPNRFDPRFMAYQDSARINQNSVRDLEAFNKAANSKQPYTTSAQTYDENYNTTSAANKSTYTNPRNTKNHLNPSKKIHGLTEEQRGVFHGGFNTADNGTPENLPTALYSADVTNPAMYKDEQLWLPYHTNPVQPYHVEPMELVQSKTPGPLSTSVERPAPAIPQVIPYTPTGKGFSPKTEGLTIQVPTVEVWKEKAAPFSNAVFRQNKINPDARTKLNISFDLDRRELINRGKLDSLRESVGLEPKGYKDGGETNNSSEWMGNKLDKQGFVTSSTKGGNRISFTGNARSDDWINKQLDTGNFGYNPKTGTVVKLDKPVQGLSKEDKIRGTETYAKATVTGFPSKEQQKEISKLSKEEQDLINKTNQQKREDLVVSQNEAALENPVTYAPGAAFFGGVAAPYITAGLEGATAALELPAVLGSRTLPYLTANNVLGLAGGVTGANALSSDLSSGYYTSDAPLMDKVARGVETGLNLFGSPGVTQKLGQSMQAAPKLAKETSPILNEYKNIEQLRLANRYNNFEKAHQSFPDLFPNKEVFDATRNQSQKLLKTYGKQFNQKFGPGTDEEILLYGAHDDLGKMDNNQNFLANDPFAESAGLNTDLSNQEKFLGDAYQLEFSPYFNRSKSLSGNKKFSNYLADSFEPVITKNKINKPVQVSRVSNFNRPIKTMRGDNSDFQMINYNDLKEGDIIYPEHNWSTTSDLNTDVWGSGNPNTQTMRINLPEGQSVFRPNMFKGSQFSNEQEVVLPPKLGYRVSGINPQGYTHENPRFILDVVNQYKQGGKNTKTIKLSTGKIITLK